MHVALDLDELPLSARRALAQWPRTQLPAVLIRLIELGLCQTATESHDLNPRPTQLRDWLHQHQIKQNTRMSFNSYNTFVQPPSAIAWVACPTANQPSDRHLNDEVQMAVSGPQQSINNAANVPKKTDNNATSEASGYGTRLFTMLTTKLFGARSESTSKPTTTENSDNNRIKRRHRKKTKHPHSQRQHARNLSSELGLPSSTDELTLSRPLRHLPNSSVNETKTTWSSSVFRRFSKRRQLKAESSEAFTIDPGFYRSPGETEYQSTRHIRANTMVEISNLSNTSLTAQPGPIASAACTCKPVSNHRWSRLSWPWQPASPPPLQLPGSCDIHSPLPSPIAPTRPRPTFTLSDFLLPSEMARLHEKNSVLDECEGEDDEDDGNNRHSSNGDEDMEEDASSWPDFRDRASNSIQEWVAAIPKEPPVSLASFTIPTTDPPGTSRRSCAIAPEIAESDFTTTDATVNDEYRHGPWPDNESESSIGDELSMIESFEDGLLDQQAFNTSFGIRICPENVLGLVSNLLERGALDDSYLADDAMDSFERDNINASYEHSLYVNTQQQQQQQQQGEEQEEYNQASRLSWNDQSTDLLAWHDSNPNHPSLLEQQAYCT